MTLHVHPIPAFQDNYIWIIHNKAVAVVVDPGESEPVESYLAKHQLKLQSILITHHHFDHINGVEQLQSQWNCDVFGPSDPKIQFEHNTVNEQCRVVIDQLNLEFKVIETPGHTQSHVCYYNDHWLFCGDTLFSIGCGRMFEGTAAEYVESLNKLKQLNPETSVFCTHEYTLSNIAFALAIEPENKPLLVFQNHVSKLRKSGKVSLPSSINTELELNPFLKTNNPNFQKKVAIKCQQSCDNEITCFTLLRGLKDIF